MYRDQHTQRMFSTLELGYSNLLLGCDRLLCLGEGATSDIDRQECREVGAALISCLENVRLLEDLSLMPALEHLAREDPVMRHIFRRLSAEHCEDACQMEEVLETLDALAGRCPLAAGYARLLFVGFARGMRRHVHMERYAMRRIVGIEPATTITQ
ncbi:hemerythrin domain-containing protein [Pelagibacterium limicola]|uniref:hemerythrin domain-containing protein n=1 Tax=Pelagibacterium limicola TaxID=2791022 RepID=UPI0018AF5912|nr:hemerythrin domain-containing protein [Pelagibacterium limicola]